MINALFVRVLYSRCTRCYPSPTKGRPHLSILMKNKTLLQSRSRRNNPVKWRTSPY